jgi:hypothetical protein
VFRKPPGPQHPIKLQVYKLCRGYWFPLTMTYFDKEEYFTLQVFGFTFVLLTVAGLMIFEVLLKGLVLSGMCTCQRIITPSKFYIFFFL